MLLSCLGVEPSPGSGVCTLRPPDLVRRVVGDRRLIRGLGAGGVELREVHPGCPGEDRYAPRYGVVSDVLRA